jgi:hypothetical protein
LALDAGSPRTQGAEQEFCPGSVEGVVVALGSGVGVKKGIAVVHGIHNNHRSTADHLK